MDRRSLQAQLPTGVTIYLPDEAARLRGLQERLVGVFRLWGFREVMTPTYEFFDVLALGTDEALQERMFKMVDRETGRMLALRADVTPQIARIAATRLRDRPKPYRLAYRTNVFRYDEPRVGRQREFYQAGVELIGLDKPEADAEMIAMAIEGFRAAGLTRFQIDVGQVEFVRGILEGLAVEREVARGLRDALRRKDAAELARLVGALPVGSATAELLLALPTLHGRAEVLPRAARLVQNPRSERAVQSLSEVHRLLAAYGLADAIILDLGEVRGFDYYSGVTFEGYVAGFGTEVCGGGRYDHLLARFGEPSPATGFAFDVNRLLLALEAQGVELPVRGPEVFVIDFTGDKETALALSRRLRDLGLAVCRDIMTRPLEESLAYAREIRAARVLVIDPAGLARGEVRLLDPATGHEEVAPLADLMASPARVLEPASRIARA
jgi:ATP phosphoribosyltransferase regulatory subunit